MTSATDFLMAEYVRRKNSNNRYSERSFAQALGLSPGFLKLLFQGKKQISLERARQVSYRLQWTEEQRAKFLNSLQADSAKKSKTLKGKFLLSDADFFEISDWFHFAVIELIKARNGRCTLDGICKYLQISKTEAAFALTHLMRLNLIEEFKKDTFQVLESYEVPSISSSGIRKYHQQILQRAKDAVEMQSMAERDLRGLTIAFDKDRLTEAKKDIQKFTAQFEKKYGSGSKNSVYQLSLAFFRLDTGDL
jgi:uncharacterized protein (TIGR02147 family)